MNFWRSSPLSFLSPACLLHSFILLCCPVIFSPLAVVSPLRQALMNFLRASPSSFLVAACSLQSFMRACCFFCASEGCFFSCAKTGETVRDRVQSAASRYLMCFLL